uniref:Uncharacterized protein n=1 Tax=Glossina austeni TaxID=7395 RepID=A0A1A9UN35_GLOAU
MMRCPEDLIPVIVPIVPIVAYSIWMSFLLLFLCHTKAGVEQRKLPFDSETNVKEEQAGLDSKDSAKHKTSWYSILKLMLSRIIWCWVLLTTYFDGENLIYPKN